jgi:hypothetical protein
VRKAVLAALDAPRLRPAPALLSILGVLLLAAGLSALISQDEPRGTDGNAYQRELASNGPFSSLPPSHNELIVRVSRHRLSLVASLLRSEISEPNGLLVAIRRIFACDRQPWSACRLNSAGDYRKPSVPGQLR